MFPKNRFLGVEHKIIGEKPPYLQGDVLHAKVKIRNLKPKPIKRRFCYVLDFREGRQWRKMEFDLGPNEEQVHSLQPPYYLRFTGNFQIILLKGEAGRRFNEEGEPQNPPIYQYGTLFLGNVRDREGYEFQLRITEAGEEMSRNTDAIRESNKQIGKTTDTIASVGKYTLYLTMAIVGLVVAEILTLFIG